MTEILILNSPDPELFSFIYDLCKKTPLKFSAIIIEALDNLDKRFNKSQDEMSLGDLVQNNFKSISFKGTLFEMCDTHETWVIGGVSAIDETIMCSPLQDPNSLYPISPSVRIRYVF